MTTNTVIHTLIRVLGPRYARPVRAAMMLMVAAAIAEGLSYAMILPVLRALFGGRPAEAWPWIGAFGLALAGYAVLRFFADLRGFRAGGSLLEGMYDRFGTQLNRLPLGWYGPRRVGEISALASSGVLQVMGVIAHLIGPLISASVTPVTIVLVMLAADWQMGVAALIAVPTVALVHTVGVRLTDAADAERMEHDEEATGRIIEYIQAQPVLRAGGRSGERFHMLDDALVALQRSSRRSTASALPGVLGLGLVVQAAFTALVVIGAYLMVGGGANVPEILALLVLAARCAEPLRSLSDLGGQIHSSRTVLEKLDAVLQTPSLPEPRDPLQPDGYDLQLDAVTFGNGDRTVLEDLSLTVPQGTRLAIVGPSGAGKSTLLRLLARFHDVDEGAVRWGGVDVRSMTPESLMVSISVVFQEVHLFDGTIEDNVRLGRYDADAVAVHAAAEAACVTEVVERLPQGWASRVGEGGRLLSGGERQRVSIARALLKQAPIMLLDEATSAMDPVTAGAVLDGLERLAPGRTVIMVAHRMQTIQRADHVAFLADGRIIEHGTHEELLRNDGRYAAFWRAEMAPMGDGGR